MRLHGHGLAVDLPVGWEGAITLPTVDAATRERAARRGVALATPPVLHAASAPLPRVRGDFGSGVVETLGRDDAFVAIVAYGPAEEGTALFDRPLVRRLTPRELDPRTLQRTIAGQAGYQRFCSEAGRPLCVYVVTGGARNLEGPNAVLASLEVGG